MDSGTVGAWTATAQFLLMRHIVGLAERLSPRARGIRRQSEDDPRYFLETSRLHALRMASTWTMLAFVSGVVYFLAAVTYNAVTGHRSFLVDNLFSAPVLFSGAGVVLQGLRAIAAGTLARLHRTAPESRVPSRVTRWLLTTHNTDLVVQLVATVVMVACLLFVVGPVPGEHVPL